MNNVEWTPEIDIVRFTSVDVITTSGNYDEDEMIPVPVFGF